ncbi:hypothetical protein QYH69_13340 [Paraburkholderia sp. SARCC-3016]|uniref:hypothetical protein n=1 Tax=Paraburkholderia sp. SARCC-3016 TaxID=3058611 RepID=UPI002806C54E|nr:hypothetical protein [Paraburkholderia sp. SARCC-3016]MDQ7978229.1 hypothetical protein [Paraburkholderia sp. SARCC-3016]
MKTTLTAISCAVGCALFPLAGAAADFGGKNPLICATVDAHSCDPGEICERALPADIGLPQFMRIDFAKKTIEGTSRSTPIESMEKMPDQILMQGKELGFAWTLVLDSTTGEMTSMIADRDHAYVLFGACTPR